MQDLLQQGSTGLLAHGPLGEHGHPALTLRANLAQAYYAVGRLSDAATLLRGVAADCERVLPAGHPLSKTVRESLQAIAGD